MPKKDVTDLTDRQKLYCKHYLATFNGKDSAIAAGYSPKSADAQSSQLLSNPKIRAYLSRELEKTTKKLDITRERVLDELRRIAFADLRDIADVDENEIYFKPSKSWSDDAAATIQSITSNFRETKFGEARTLTVKQHDKIRALELLGKYLALWASDSPSGPMTITLNYSDKGKNSG